MNTMLKRILLFVLIVLGASMTYAQERKVQVVDKVAAVVGKNIILQSDVENQYIQYRMQGGPEGTGSTIRCGILEDQ